MKVVYFVSGHIDLSDQDFRDHYHGPLEEALASEESHFVLGDADGADYQTQCFLHQRGVSRDRVTVYHKGQNPQNPFAYPTEGPFPSHPHKDAAMTRVSNVDIAWVRNSEDMKKAVEAQGKIFDPTYISGTEKNLLRRKSQQVVSPP